MAYASGTQTLDFGAGGFVAKSTVAAQASLLAGDNIEGFIQGNDSTVDYNQYTHARILPHCVNISAENIIAGSSFDLVATSNVRLKGLIAARWVRSS